MTLIKAVNISQRFENQNILHNINLEISKGEVFTIIGPTGSGKTTLIRILDLIDKPFCGELFYGGVKLNGTKSRQDARRKMAYVQQRPVIFSMSVFDNVACGLKWRHIKPAVTKSKTEAALTLVSMNDFRQRDAKTLSGGEIQRIALARALVIDPEVLFLDEPTANMDPMSAQKIEDVLEHIIQEGKTTVVMTTHNMSQSQRMATRLAVLMHGELVQTGSVGEIFLRPQNRAVAEFVGIENIIRGEVIKKDNELVTVKVGIGQIHAVADFAVGEQVSVLIRPETIVFSLSKEAGSSRNVFYGQVTQLNTSGSLVRIEVDCGFPLLGILTTSAARELNIFPGKELYASFKATATHVIKRV